MIVMLRFTNSDSYQILIISTVFRITTQRYIRNKKQLNELQQYERNFSSTVSILSLHKGMV